MQIREIYQERHVIQVWGDSVNSRAAPLTRYFSNAYESTSKRSQKLEEEDLRVLLGGGGVSGLVRTNPKDKVWHNEFRSWTDNKTY